MDEEKLFRIEYTGVAYVYAEDEQSARDAFCNDEQFDETVDIDSVKEW